MQFMPIARIDPSDDHRVLAFLRRCSRNGEIVFPREWFQFHLRTGDYDRTPCCKSITEHAEIEKPAAPLGDKPHIARRCLRCGQKYHFRADQILPWLALALDARAVQAAAGNN